jgi:dipeptidyl aminopeptidase/acylaminoacyl peptidase
MVTVTTDMRPIVHKARRLIIAALLGVTIGAAVTPILVAEGALHIGIRLRPDPHEANAIARGSASAWEPARVTAADGVLLDGWLFTPREPNGSGVILLHGIGDTRSGMAAHASFLLHAGFTVLLPDSRGHGSSGGSVVTYGIRESADIHAWAGWFLQKRPIAHQYGLGQSMGAAILLESLPREPRFRAIVADCPFDTFEDVAWYRLQHASGLGRWAAWPVVQVGFLYTRLIYGVDLRQASPADAVRSTTVPILLIHGTDDVNIPPSQSAALHALNPQSTVLWLVPGARHIGSLARNPQEYIRRVTEWFRSHQ